MSLGTAPELQKKTSGMVWMLLLRDSLYLTCQFLLATAMLSAPSYHRGVRLCVRPSDTLSSPIKTVQTRITRHKLSAYHNKHCWRAFRRCQRRWPWTTLNPKKIGFAFVLQRTSSAVDRHKQRPFDILRSGSRQNFHQLHGSFENAPKHRGRHRKQLYHQ